MGKARTTIDGADSSGEGFGRCWSEYEWNSAESIQGNPEIVCLKILRIFLEYNSLFRSTKMTNGTPISLDRKRKEKSDDDDFEVPKNWFASRF